MILAEGKKAALARMVSEGLLKEVTFELRPEWQKDLAMLKCQGRPSQAEDIQKSLRTDKTA